MDYVSATKAAQIIGVTPRTITDWLKTGKLSGHHPEGKRNRVAIPKSEVEAIARERSLYREEKETSDIDPLKQEIETLKQEVQSLKNEVRTMRENRPVETFSYDDSSVTPRPVKRTTTRNQPDRSLPDGAIAASEFAAMYGVNPSTFRDHYKKGIGPDLDKAPVSSRPKPGRESRQESEWYVLPEQVEGVVDFWKRHGVRYQEPETQLSIWHQEV
jgi:hypothetical protein